MVFCFAAKPFFILQQNGNSICGKTLFHFAAKRKMKINDYIPCILSTIKNTYLEGVT